MPALLLGCGQQLWPRRKCSKVQASQAGSPQGTLVVASQDAPLSSGPRSLGGSCGTTALGLGGGTRQPREGPAVSRSWAWQAQDQGACLHTPGHNTAAHLGSLGSLCTEARLQGGHPADPGHGRGERRQVALLLVCSLPQLHLLAASTP